jgi:hypothetical protein
MIPLLFALAVVGGGATEPAPVAPAVVTASPVETKKQRAERLRQEKLDLVVCRKVVPTGSRLGVEECRPQWQWEQIRDATNRALDNVPDMAQGRLR